MMLKISLLFQSILPLNAIVFGLNTYSLISYFDSLIVINRYSLICFLTIQLIIIILTIISFFQTKNFIKHGEELPVTIEKIENNIYYISLKTAADILGKQNNIVWNESAKTITIGN